MFRRALALYREALQLKPDWEEGWWFVGILSYDSDRYADGRDAFLRLVQVNENSAPAWAFLGLCEFETGAYDASLSHIERRLELASGVPPEARFQPYRLANSKCFLGDDPRIRCTACHNPHVDAVRDSASYDRNCLACHASKSASREPAAHLQKPCPVGDRNCASCHMPKMNLPLSPAVFTDHQIRVVRPGDPYPN